VQSMQVWFCFRFMITSLSYAKIYTRMLSHTHRTPDQNKRRIAVLTLPPMSS
jgi:hypothetical protein